MFSLSKVFKSLLEVKRKHSNDWKWNNIDEVKNEEDIRKNCEFYLNENKINFSFKHEL